ncbi:MAG TPA: hypothetical protein VHI52_10500, partial [Verrucomicrobiae bacterium]|nr:hypothetical protein [Verrucomicrobiae bacterium]
MRSCFGVLVQAFSGLRIRLLLLVLLVCAPLVVLILHSADEDRHRAMANWRQRSTEMLQIANSEEVEMVDATRQFLLALSESSALRSPKSKDCNNFLHEELRYYPRYSRLGILRPDGKLLACALRPGAGATFDQSFLRPVLETKAFATGGFPVRAADGKPAITFGYPVLDRNGRVAEVVFAELDHPWFTRLGSDFSIPFPKGATWMEIDETGKMITRYPSEGDWFGAPIPEATLLPAVFAQPEGAVEHTNHQGRLFFYAFNSRPSNLSTAHVVSILGIPRQVLFAEADRLLQRNLTLLAVAAGLAFVIGWVASKILVLGPVQALVR